MAEKRHPGLPIPDDWNGLDWCQFSICWPDSLQWRAILAGFITTPMLGRTWDAATGSIVDTQAIGQQIFENNLDWRYCLVASCDNGEMLSTAIRYLADKLASVSCCGQPGVIGGPGIGGSGVSPESPGETVIENEPPTGWDTWAEYQADHCDYVTYLLEQIEQSLDNMSVLNFALGIVADIVAGLVTLISLPIAGSQLFELAVWLVQTGSNFSSVITAFDNARDDMKCDLFLALDPSQGRSDALATYNAAVDALSLADDVTVAVKNTFANILTQDAVNNLYVLDESKTYPTGDCELCQEANYYIKRIDRGNDYWYAWDGSEQDRDFPYFVETGTYIGLSLEVYESDQTTRYCPRIQFVSASPDLLHTADAQTYYCGDTPASVNPHSEFATWRMTWFDISVGSSGTATIHFRPPA